MRHDITNYDFIQKSYADRKSIIQEFYDSERTDEDTIRLASLFVISEAIKSAYANRAGIHNVVGAIFGASISFRCIKEITRVGAFDRDKIEIEGSSNDEPKSLDDKNFDSGFNVSKKIGFLADEKYIEIFIERDTNDLYFIKDKIISGSIGCECCLNGDHNPKAVKVDLSSVRVNAEIETLFKELNELSAYRNLLAWDIFNGGLVLGTYAFALTIGPFSAAYRLGFALNAEKATLIATSPIWMPLTVGCFALSLALAVATYSLSAAISVVALVAEVFISKPIKGIVNYGKKCLGRPDACNRTISFLDTLKQKSRGDELTKEASAASPLLPATPVL